MTTTELLKDIKYYCSQFEKCEDCPMLIDEDYFCPFTKLPVAEGHDPSGWKEFKETLVVEIKF